MMCSVQTSCRLSVPKGVLNCESLLSNRILMWRTVHFIREGADDACRPLRNICCGAYRSQISLAYCSIERSEEKMPALAMFVRDIFAKRVRS